MGSANEPIPQFGTPTAAYPATMQYPSAPPPSSPVYPTPAPPSPLGQPRRTQPQTSNLSMTAIPIEQVQGHQTPTAAKFHAATTNIVPIVTCIITLGLFYGLLTGSTKLLDSSTILIVASVGFLLANLVNVMVLIFKSPRPLTKFIPFLFSTFASLTLMLFFVAVQVAKNEFRLLFDEQGLSALLGSIGLFSGLGLGSAIVYSIHGV